MNGNPINLTLYSEDFRLSVMLQSQLIYAPHHFVFLVIVL